MNREITKTPTEWLATPEYKMYTVMDPDGWDRTNYTEDWARPLTLDEFVAKLQQCTVIIDHSQAS